MIITLDLVSYDVTSEETTTMKNLPEHLFIASDGALYDTRKADWHKLPPLRPVYRRHFRSIENVEQFKASLRAGPYTWPGGYELAFHTSDGAAICFGCAGKEARLIIDSIRHKINDGWRITGMVYSTIFDDSFTCDHCGKELTE